MKNFSNLSVLNYSNFFKFIFCMTIFSISGIPPFMFFFNKLNFIFLMSSLDFKLVLFFYIFFFISIYFYISSIRHIMVFENFKINVLIKSLTSFNYFFIFTILLVSFFNTFGIFFMDDLVLIFKFVSLNYEIQG